MGCTKETDAYDMAACCAADLVLRQRNQDHTGDPVNVVTGTFSLVETDFVWPQARLPMVFTRAYDSGVHNRGEVGDFGPGWTHSWNLRLEVKDGELTYIDDRHVRIVFPPGAPPPAGAQGMRVDATPEGWTVQQLDGLAADFDGNGLLLRLRRPGPGRDSVLSFHRVDGRIQRVIGATGEVLLHWQHDRIASITAPDGRAWRYKYDSHWRLVSVHRPSGVCQCYSYYQDVHCETVEGESSARPVDRAIEGIGHIFSPAYPGDRNPVIVTNVYTSSGRVARQSDALGAVTRFEYNLYTRMTGVTDPEGWTTVYASNPQGNTVWVRTPEGRVTEHVFDDQSNLLASIEEGLRTEYVTFLDPNWHDMASDLSGRPACHRADYLRFTSADLTEAHDANGRAPLLRDALGRVTRFSDRDAFGNARRIDWPDGEHTLIIYDARSGLQLRQEKRRGTELLHWRTFDLDDLGNIIRSTEGPPPLRVEERQYDSTGTRVREQRVWTGSPDFAVCERFAYDTSGRLVRREVEVPIEPGGAPQVSVEETGYDLDGNISWQVSGTRGRAWNWDAGGRLTSVRLFDPVTRKPGAWLERRQYDDAGRCVTRTDAAGGVTRFAYDLCGRVVQTELPNGTVRRLTYDRDGRTIAESGPDGERHMTYEGLTTTTTDDLGRVWTVERDAVGRTLRSFLGGQGITWCYSDNQVDIEHADGAWERRGQGWVERGPLPSQRVEWDRDTLGRPLEIRVGAGVGPACCRLWKWNDATGEVTESDPIGRSTQIKLDAAGRLHAREEARATLTYKRDDSGRITRWQSADGSVDTRFEYAGERLVAVDTPGLSERWAFDEAGRPVIHEQVVDGCPVRVELRWDEAGRLTDQCTPTATMSIRGEVGQRRIQLPGRSATVDASAHRREVRWDDGSVMGSIELASGIHRWCEERDGRRWRWTIEWDSRGRPGTEVREFPTGTTMRHLRYDALNRLVGVDDEQGRERFGWSWDNRGNPVEIRRDAKPIARIKVDDSDQIVAWYDEGGVRVPVEHDNAGRIVTIGALYLAYDAAGRPVRIGDRQGIRCASDGALAGWTRAGSRERVTWSLGRPIQLPGGIDVFWLDDVVLACQTNGRTHPVWTDPWGSVVGMQGERSIVEYGPFGEATGQFPLPLGYCGRLHIGPIQDCRARLYIPALGRFAQPDPEGVADDPNRYLYGHGNPLIWTDPSGRAAERSGIGCLAHLPTVELLPLVSVEAYRAAGIEVARTDIVGPSLFETRGHYVHRDRHGEIVGRTHITEPSWFESQPRLVHYDRVADHVGTSFVTPPGLFESRPSLRTIDATGRTAGGVRVQGPGLFENRPHLVSHDASGFTTGSAWLVGPGWFESHPHLVHHG